ncbi:hypothetical protein ETAA8_00060 [Anatilimnocola aggregata]|uniref:Uncharacterized protein n=1 Tax=Anatilimnocola aggregata TaxID=2528021 RepID=A0A517Y418_9BACT|nr:hypothetical protein [Anatilimnocola aggregata]QDU24945.1 hypothetical protein ETAA8_00060 [Anatilimnocola aggregata]
MITFSRRLARRVRAVFRRALRPSPRETSPSVAIVATPRTFRFTARNARIAVAYEEAGRFAPAELAVPLSFFDDCAGSRTDLVQLTPAESNALIARWDDDGVQQLLVVEQRPLPKSTDFPSLPEQLTKNPPRLMTALRDAAETTDATSLRYALGCIQIRGKRGEIAATDGRQLLLQRGFEFPFEDDLLIGRHHVFQASELLAADHVAVGLHDGWFTLRAGNWTVQIKVESEGRFPRVDDIIPPVLRSVASCRISPADGRRLVRSLTLLPSDDEQDSPVTIDLNGHFAVRARSPRFATPVEVTLTGHQPQGEPLRVAVNRRYLERVGKLGLGELHLFGRNAVLHARDEQRSYIWMPLAASAIVPPVPADPALTRAAA